MSSSATAAEVGTSSSCGVRGNSAERRLTARRILVVVCVTAAVTAGVLYPLARWRTASDATHCGGGGEDSAAESVGRFADDPSLKFVAALFRHGDRTPVFKYKNDLLANAFPEERGELTKRGKQHMYKKGQIFRRLYNGFLSDLYLDNEIIIKTTNKPRTHMSAALVLAGLYPPRGYQKWSDSESVWQPIPIYHDSPDDTILYSYPKMCPAFYSLNNKTFPEIVDSFDNTITAPLLSYLSEKCGQPITKENLFFLHDAFKCQESANLQLPEWLKPNYLQTIRSIFASNKTSEIMYGNPRIQKFTVGRLLQEIVSEMELRSNNTKSRNALRKMHLYSGHDVGIGNILGFMKTFLENIDFGASINLQLHFDDKIGHTVKVFYFDRWDDENGREVTVPKCGDHCKLQEFIKLVRDNLSGKWEEECQMVE